MTEHVPTYRAAQVRAAEKPLLAAGEPLMARAASALAGIAAEYLGAAGGRILVLAGGGDNGGDALFAAAELAGIDDVLVDLFLTSERVHHAGLAAAIAAGARTIGHAELVAAASGYDLLLDGIVGIGASGDPALRGTARSTVEALLPAVRAGRPRAIAVDLPSGLQPDDGSSDGVVLPASLTVTFGAVKAGLVTGSGPECAGSIVLVDLGLMPALAGQDAVGEASVAAVVRG